MDLTWVVLRLLHIVLGAFWVGAIFFTALFLLPAMAAAGPDAAKVAQELQRRRFMTVIPIAALLTILTGLDMMRRVSVNFNPAWFGTGSGMTFTIGSVAGIVAFIVGFFFMRPLMLKAQTLPPAEGQPLRARAMLLNRVVAALLLVAVSTMAVGRFM